MKTAILSFLMLSFLSLPVQAMDASQAHLSFAQASQAYKEGRWQEAIDFYEGILAGRLESAPLYYNLGNAYLKDKKLGKAVLNYLRSENLAPRDADVRANLAFARSYVENYQPFSSWGSVKRLLFMRQASDGELRWLALASFMLSGILLLWAIYQGTRKKGQVALISLFVVVGIYCVSVLALRSVHEAGHAVVIESTDARYEPSSGATVYFKVFEGAEIRLLRREDDWVKIERPDGKSAWIPLEAAQKIDL